MNYRDLANPGVFDQPIYVPGKPLNAVAEEHGLALESIDKLASNENPFGPSPAAIRAIKAALPNLNLYPDGSCHALKSDLAELHRINSDQIFVGNGSNEIIELLGHVFLRPGTEVVVGTYSFIVYRLVAELFGAKVVDVPMYNFKHDLKAMANAVTDKTRIVFVASPNNPTGMANDSRELIEFIDRLPDHVILCFDEAYAEYLTDPPDLKPMLKQGHKIVFLRTFSKIFGLGGLRLGFAYGHSDLIALLNRVRQPFNVNALAQIGGRAALRDDAFLEHCRRENERGKIQLIEGLKRLNYTVYGGSANFVFVDVGDGQVVFERLQEQGIIVRPLANYGLPEYIRVTIGREEQNDRFLLILQKLFGSRDSVGDQSDLINRG
ncbi:MAG: histidinol-phosphate transaminase [Puniceicoccaceae bacterium]|nr:MAG: histidinol-phosphate transaminase [Puniceicoccaceae bacterium]